MVVQAINTATAGLPELIGNWVMGPKSEGYVDPLDNPYGKKAGEVVGYGIGFALPFKYLEAVKTPAALGKLFPTLLRTMTAEAIFSTATEASDAIGDFRDDGNQSLGKRIGNVAMNSVTAAAGDAAFTVAAKAISSALKGIIGKKMTEVPEIVKTVEGKGSSGSRGLFDEFNALKTSEERYIYLLEKAKTMDVSTGKNKSIFYAGRIEVINPATGEKVVITAREMAERYADNLFAEKGVVKLTLERTPGGKWMDDLKLYNEVSTGLTRYNELGLSRQQVDEVWNLLSSRYAEGASGAVTAFTKNVPDIWKPKTIFWSTELPQLRQNQNVNHVNIR